ncbi:MAG: peroxidase [Micromonosporaceae bacterium]|nr:peroxidase [Micromonosporaceae bacterium]
MTYLPSLPQDAVLLHVFRAYPQAARPLLDYHQALLRGPSPFTVGERELIAGYVSGLNACHYCHGVHTATAQRFGIAEGTLTALLSDVDSAPVEERMRPVLRYVHKLTLTPSRISPADAAAILSAGWPEQALHDAASVCALFNLMNLLVDGLGVTADDTYFPTSADRLASVGYDGLKQLL